MPLLILTVYIPTADGDPKAQSQWEDFINRVGQSFTKYPNVIMILLGDLNAQLGGNDEALLSKFLGSSDLVLPPPWFARSSRNSKINSAEKHLVSLAVMLNLGFLNCPVNPKHSGCFTCITSYGFSIADHLLAPPSLYSLTINVEVGEYLGVDYLPLILEFISPADGYIHLYYYRIPIMKPIKWCPEFDYQISKILNQENTNKCLAHQGLEMVH